MTKIDGAMSPSADASTAAGGDPSDGGLRGKLGVTALVFTVIAFNGPLIGLSGVVPYMISAGNGLAVPLTFFVIGAVVLIFAVGLNAMASRMTHAGAFYTYITAGIGRPAGIAAGFVASIAYIAAVAGTYALFASIVIHLLDDTFGIQGGPAWWVWALIGWAGVTILSLFNIELSAKVLGTASALEIALVLVWNARVYFNGGPQGRSFDAIGAFGSGSLPLALIFGVLCLTGFESLQVFRAESRDPNRTVPRATYISVLVLALLYAMNSYDYIVSYGPAKALAAGGDDPTGAVLASITKYVAAPVGDVANCLLVTSAFAACLGIQSVIARYIFALGRDGVLPRKFGVASARFGSPMRAAALTGLLTVVALLIPTIGGAGPVLTFASLNGAGAYCLLLLWFVTSVAVVCFFRKDRRGANLWQVVIAPVLAAVGLGIVGVLGTIYFNDILGQPTHTLANVILGILVAIILAGIALALWKRHSDPEVYRRLGHEADTVDA